MTKPHKVSILPTGKITIQVDPVTGTSVKYVYQRVAKGKGNIPIPGRHDLQLRRLPQASAAFTLDQMVKRLKFKDAVKTWQECDQQTKKEYNTRAVAMDMSGYNLFISDFMNGVIKQKSLWDSDTSSWDDDNTLWFD